MRNVLLALNLWLYSFKDIGLLLFRIGIGGMFMWHGFPKIAGGMETWTGLGKTMALFGITFAPALWGFLSACSEFFGGLFVLLGFLYRPACFMLVGNLLVAFISQMIGDKGLAKASQSLEDGFSFLAAIFVGPGKYSVDEYLRLQSVPQFERSRSRI